MKYYWTGVSSFEAAAQRTDQAALREQELALQRVGCIFFIQHWKAFFHTAMFLHSAHKYFPPKTCIYIFHNFCLCVFHEKKVFSLQIIDQQNAINFPRGFGNWPNIQNLEVNRILVVFLRILNKHKIFLQKDNLKRKLMRCNRHAGQIVLTNTK